MCKRMNNGDGVFQQAAGGFYLEGGWFVLKPRPPRPGPLDRLKAMLGRLQAEREPRIMEAEACS